LPSTPLPALPRQTPFLQRRGAVTRCSRPATLLKHHPRARGHLAVKLLGGTSPCCQWHELIQSSSTHDQCVSEHTKDQTVWSPASWCTSAAGRYAAGWTRGCVVGATAGERADRWSRSCLDQGPGITEVLPHIFGAYFTTRRKRARPGARHLSPAWCRTTRILHVKTRSARHPHDAYFRQGTVGVERTFATEPVGRRGLRFCA